jgi:ABC-type branched-subunit amino acid transport system ATPase component/ABC-type branched-subunit amino acid transport system permease subunit
MIVRRILGHPVAILLMVLVGLSVLAGPASIPIGRITQIAVYTLYAIGVAILVSYAGLVPFGACVFFGVAAYATALASIHWFGNELLGLLAGIIVAALIATVLGPIILRRRGLYFSLLTLACSQIAFEVALRWSALTGGDNGIQNVPAELLRDPWTLHVVTVVIVLLVSGLVWRVMHSPFGRALQGIRDNEQRAGSIGYATRSYKYGAFVFSAAVIGLAGGLQTYLIRGAYANYLSWEHAGDALLMLLVGGAHHFLGSLWGAITFILLRDNLSALFENWWLAFAPIIILFTLFAQNGIHGLLFRRNAEAWTLVRNGIPDRPASISPLDLGVFQQASAGPILSVRGLKKSFGSVETARNIDLDIMPNQLHSLIGPNGAGKTTLFNILSGEIRPDAGKLLWCGQDITDLAPHKRARLGVGRSFQIANAFRDLTAFENVRLAVHSSRAAGRRPGIWHDAHDDEAINSSTWSALDLVGLADLAAVVGERLSHGERRLLEIAITIATNARLLLLDEPLAGLTEADRVRVSSLIRKLADTHAVLLVEHDIDRVLALSDRISVLYQGELIADGKPDEVAAHPQVISAYLGKPAAEQEPPTFHTNISARTAPAGEPILTLRNVAAGYDGSRILDGIDFTIGENEVVGVLGRNGVGKTTLLYTIMGVVPLLGGTITFRGKSLAGDRPFEINRLGIAIVPEGRRLFANLSVADNLKLSARPGGASPDEVFELFPKLKTLHRRKAEYLSGGERQMVAIARSLMAPAGVILLDEPFEGLAPAIVQDVSEALLRLKGTRGMVLVEHDSEKIMAVADRIYVLVNGRIAFHGTSEDFQRDTELRSSLLGIANNDAPHARSPISHVEGQLRTLPRLYN